MTENEKIELFDKWYDENYDEWAEGEEGIALREELEQAFKSGIATLEKENAELKQAEKGKVVEHFEAYGQCRDSRRIAELEAQIEKMKRCEICKHYQGESCNYHSNWVKDCKENGMKLFELKEIKEK